MKVLQFPLSKITFGFILGIVTSFYWSISLNYIYFGLILSLLSFLILFLIQRQTAAKRLFIGATLYLLSFFIGALTLFIHTESYQKSNYIHNDLIFKKPQEITVVIREKLKSNLFNDRYIALINTINSTQSSGKIILNSKKNSHTSPFKTGTYLSLKVLFYKNKIPNNPNQFDYSAYLNKKQLYAQVYAEAENIKIGSELKKDIWYYTEQLRTRIRENLEKNHFNKKELNIAIALILGQKQDISPETMQDFQYAGAIHILSVSGLHVGYLLLFLTFILKPISNTKKGALIKLLITLFTLASFALIAGLSPSVLRSVTMFSFVAIGYHLRRSVNIYHTLLVSALLILLFQPYFLFDVGFQLSYLALFFIVWLHPLLASLYKPKHKMLNYFWTLLTVSIAAQIGTLPLSIYYFHQFPDLFFVTNLVIVPLLIFIMIAGIIVMLLASVGLTPIFLIKPLEWGIFGLDAIIHFVASFEQFLIKGISFNSALLISCYLGIIATIIWFKKPSYNKLVILLLAMIAVQLTVLHNNWSLEKQEEWIVFNSKKSTLIVSRQGKKVCLQTDTNSAKTVEKNQMIQSYLVGNFSYVESVERIKNLQFFNGTKILIIDSTGVYPAFVKPDIVLLLQSPKINLDRLLKTIQPRLVIADASNYKTIQKNWKKSCEKQKIPFHATGEKGFFKLN